jgi:hypothetical protein
MRRTGKLSLLPATGTAGIGAGGMTKFMVAPDGLGRLSLKRTRNILPWSGLSSRPGSPFAALALRGTPQACCAAPH